MFSYRSWRSTVASLIVFSFLAGFGYAQETAPPADVVTPPPSSFIPQQPKSWYLLLSHLPMTRAQNGGVWVAGTEYQSNTFLITFQQAATGEEIKRTLGAFPLSTVESSEDGVSYYVSLSDPSGLFQAVDFYNSSPLVIQAVLVPIETDSDAVVPPSPLYPTNTEGGLVGKSMPESMWPGDADGDFLTDVADAMKILRASVGLVAPAPLETARMDVNRDGRISVADVILTLNIVVGNGLPPPYGYRP